MSELKIIQGDRPREVLASGALRVQAGDPPMTFTYGGESTTVRFYLTERPREHTGRLIGTLRPDEITPGYDAIHDVGGAEVRLQLEASPVPTAPGQPPAFLFFYAVTVPAAAPRVVGRAA